jgi:hypothetical protein
MRQAIVTILLLVGVASYAAGASAQTRIDEPVGPTTTIGAPYPSASPTVIVPPPTVVVPPATGVIVVPAPRPVGVVVTPPPQVIVEPSWPLMCPNVNASDPRRC